MSFPINPKINPYQQQPAMGMNSESSGNNGVGMGINTSQLQGQLQNIDADQVKQKSVLKNFSNDDDKDDVIFKSTGIGSKKTALMAVPLALGMAYGAGKFNKACQNKDYDASLIGRINNWGERVGQKYSFIDNGLKRTGDAINLFKIKVIDKIGPLSAFFNARVISKHAENQIKMTSSSLGSSAIEKLNKHLENGGTLKGFKDNAAATAEIGKLSATAHEKETIEKIIKICGQQDNTTSQVKNAFEIPLYKRITGKQKYLSDFIPFLKRFAKEDSFSEHVNKLTAYIAPKGKTLIGKNIGKVILNIREALTQGSGSGGIGLGIILAAYFIADSIKRAIKAPNVNGEKRKEFAEGLVSNLGWVFTMPIAISAIYHFGGLQYIGMGKDKATIQKNVKAYRNALEDFNKQATNREFANKAEYKAEWEKIKNMYKGYTKLNLKAEDTPKTAWKILTNIINKPLRLAGKILSVGLERRLPYMSRDSKGLGALGNMVKKMPYHMKGATGWVGRFLLCMMVTIPFFDKWFAKGSHLIFGKPMHSILDEGKESKEKTNQPSQPRMPQQPAQQMMKPAQKSLYNNQMNPNINDTRSSNYISSTPIQRQNLLDMYKAKSAPQEMMSMNQAPARTYMPSSSAPAMISANEPIRTYVPSVAGVVINPQVTMQENAKANEAFLKADNAEKRASQHLG